MPAALALRQKEKKEMANKGTKQETLKNSSKHAGFAMVRSARQSVKAPGMRVGVLDDWRVAGAKRGGETAPHGKRIRDGR